MENFEIKLTQAEKEVKEEKKHFNVDNLELEGDLREFAEENKDLVQKVLSEPYCIEEIEDEEARKKVAKIYSLAEEKAEDEKKNEDKLTGEELKEIDEFVKNFNPEKFEKIPPKYHKEIAFRLVSIRNGHLMGDYLTQCLEKFKGLDIQDYQKIANELIDTGQSYELIKNLEKFQGLNHREIVIKLIKTKLGEYIVRYLEKFQELNHQEIVDMLIDSKQGGLVARTLEEFQGLNHQEIADKLIATDQGNSLIINLEKFQGLNHRKIAIKLIKAGSGEYVINYLEKFQGVEHLMIVAEMIDAGEGSIKVLVCNLEKLQGLKDSTYQNIADLLIRIDQPYLLIENLKKFKNNNYEHIALNMISCRQGIYVVNNLSKFENIDYDKIKLNLIMSGDAKILNNNAQNFFSKEYLEYLEKSNLLPSEAVIIDKFSENLVERLRNNLEVIDYKLIFEIIKKYYPDQGDQENINKLFEEGADYFGYDKMFKYIRTKDRHDILYNFRKIVEIAKNSGLRSEQFYGQILNQIINDDGLYGEENGEIESHQLMNNIADAVNINEIDEVLLKAKNFNDIEKLRKLVKLFDKKENIFQSWKNLKKYYELLQLLHKTKILEQLKELNVQGKEKLYKYIETLAFHPSIDMGKVMEFWQRPQEFLEIGDIHASHAHDLKKPSNYIEMPHLDLSAENLRDGLVEGELDKLQDWQPLEINYQLSENIHKKQKSIRYYLAKEIGVSDVEIRKAVGIGEEEKLPRNGKLFSTLSKRFKAEDLDLVEYLKGNQEISKDLEKELEQYKNDKEESRVEYRAKINLKSDPDGVVAGNDTACCMPFGSGKNNVYTYNPVCSLFTVQKKVGDKWRTIAQSVLTKDIDVKRNISELISEINNENIKLDELVSEDVLIQSKNIITCDNIEVAPNFKENSDKDKILEYIYRDFFQEYIKNYSERERLDDSQVIIGKGFTDAISHLDQVDNTFVPIAPVGYSDNVGEKALKLDLKKENKDIISERKISKKEKPKRADLRLDSIKGISDATFKDSLQVAYLEGKAYKDNETLMEHLHNMENALIAKDINNTMKDRANLSLKYTNTEGKMQGYILAYEGKYKDGEVIYIADLAASPEAKLAGGRLIKGFTERYKKEYLDKGNFVPILAEAREQTSYKIIKNQLDQIGKDLGVEFEIEELGENKRGGDTMHTILIKPKK